MENNQVINNLMSDMLDKIEKENSGDDCIQQGLKNSQDTEILLFPRVVIPNLTAPKKNDIDLTPKMDNLIAEVKSDLNKTTAYLKQFEKCVLDVLSTKQSKLTDSKVYYKQLKSLELKIKPSSKLMNNNLKESKNSELLQQLESKAISNGKCESFEFYDANLNINSKDCLIDETNFQIVDSLMGEMLDTIENENSEYDSINQKIENSQEREKLKLSLNTENILTLASIKKVSSDFLKVNLNF